MDDARHLAERITPKNFTFDVVAAASFTQKMYACASVSILTNLVGFYLIVRHSPPSMTLYRWCLLDVSVSEQVTPHLAPSLPSVSRVYGLLPKRKR